MTDGGRREREIAFPIIAARLLERMAKDTLTPEAEATMIEAMRALASPLSNKEIREKINLLTSFNCRVWKLWRI